MGPTAVHSMRCLDRKFMRHRSVHAMLDAPLPAYLPACVSIQLRVCLAGDLCIALDALPLAQAPGGGGAQRGQLAGSRGACLACQALHLRRAGEHSSGWSLCRQQGGKKKLAQPAANKSVKLGILVAVGSPASKGSAQRITTSGLAWVSRPCRWPMCSKQSR